MVRLQFKDMIFKFRYFQESNINLLPLFVRYTGMLLAATRENRSSGFPTRSDTNRSVQSQEQARYLKFWL